MPSCGRIAGLLQENCPDLIEERNRISVEGIEELAWPLDLELITAPLNSRRDKGAHTTSSRKRPRQAKGRSTQQWSAMKEVGRYSRRRTHPQTSVRCGSFNQCHRDPRIKRGSQYC
jgi:hypothetical protein